MELGFAILQINYRDILASGSAVWNDVVQWLAFFKGIFMPTISMFFGVIIRMYFFDNQQHHAPHIHAECQNEQASYLIETGERITGKMPLNKEKLIQAWMLIHKEDLFADWELAVKGEEPFRIDPLR